MERGRGSEQEREGKEGGEGRKSTCTLLPHSTIYAQELLTYCRLLYILCRHIHSQMLFTYGDNVPLSCKQHYLQGTS